MTIRDDVLPQWLLQDCKPINREKIGARVFLPIAEGSPGAMLTADHAEDLGKQLIEAAKKARQMAPTE